MTRSTPEIITLQIGHYASYVGTHWWNVQEASFVYDPTAEVELDHGVLFREGITNKGQVTFTPRLLVVELRGSLGGLRRRGRLYAAEVPPSEKQEVALWQGGTERHQQPPLPPVPPPDRRYSEDVDDRKEDDKDICQVDERGDSATTTAEDEGTATEDNRTQVKVWSDFLRTHLHPWSVHMLDEPAYDSADEPFDVFHCGETQYHRETFRDEFEDRLRAFAEECDRLVGFHVLADGGDGFGGVAGGALSHLADEYPRRSVLLAPVQSYPASPLTLPQAVHQTVNTVLTLDCGLEHATVTLPLSVQAGWTAPLRPPSHRSFSHLQYRPEKSYESSALLAAALDTATLPWRSKASGVSLWEVSNALTSHGRRVASLKSALPLGIGSADDLPTWLRAGKLKFTGLTPDVSDDVVPVWSAAGVLRGVNESTMRSGTGASSWLEHMQRRVSHPSRASASQLREPLLTGTAFPALFASTVNRAGRIGPDAGNCTGVTSVPMAVTMETGAAVGGSISRLHSAAAGFNVSKFHRFAAAGLQADDFSEVVERVSNLAQCYAPDS